MWLVMKTWLCIHGQENMWSTEVNFHRDDVYKNNVPMQRYVVCNEQFIIFLNTVPHTVK